MSDEQGNKISKALMIVLSTVIFLLLLVFIALVTPLKDVFSMAREAPILTLEILEGPVNCCVMSFCIR